MKATVEMLRNMIGQKVVGIAINKDNQLKLFLANEQEVWMNNLPEIEVMDDGDNQIEDERRNIEWGEEG